MGAKHSSPETDRAEVMEKMKKGGEPLKGDFVMLPGKERGCTDILCLLLFILFVGAMIAVGIIGFQRGDPDVLHYGYDFNGNVCGRGVNEGKESLYYPYPFPEVDAAGNPQDTDFSWAVCLPSCPNQTDTFPPNQCMMAFDVHTDNGQVVRCGGEADGKTLMSQFLPNNGNYGNDSISALGYVKYCLNRVPICTPCSGPECCDSKNQETGTIGANANVPRTLDITYVDALPPNPNSTEYKKVEKWGIQIGRKYGFCYVPIPSTAASISTRCFPYYDAGQGDAAVASVQAGVTAYNTNAGTSDTVSNDDLAQSVTFVANAISDPQSTFSSLVDEVQQHWEIIVASGGIALGIALVYTQILRIAALPLTFVVLALLWALLGASTAVLAFKAGIIEQGQLPLLAQDAVASAALTLPDGVTLAPAQTNQELTIIAAVVVGVAFLVYTILLCVMAPRIYLACKVIQQAAICLTNIPTALLFPIFQWIFMCALFLWAVFVFIYLASAGTWNPDTRTYAWDDDVRRAIVFHLFGVLWVRAFILAVGNLVIAGATADWFIVNDKKMLKLPVVNALGRTLRYHTGTAAFGSLLIAIVQFIRWVFRYYMYQLKKLDPDNKLVKVFACIGECCLGCLERFLNFVNKNAYIQTAIYATSFCPSAKNAFSLLLRNCLRVAALATVATIFNQIGKLFIAVATGFLCALIIAGGDIANVANAPVFSVTIIVLLAYGIASAFLDVWDMVVETIFQCFCMDLEKGSGKAQGELSQFVAENEAKGKQVREVGSQF